MTLRERKKLQRDFFEAAGPNTAAFRALVDTLPDACFYMKDLNCRIMALNRRNCEVCNIKNAGDVAEPLYRQYAHQRRPEASRNDGYAHLGYCARNGLLRPKPHDPSIQNSP